MDDNWYTPMEYVWATTEDENIAESFRGYFFDSHCTTK